MIMPWFYGLRPLLSHYSAFFDEFIRWTTATAFEVSEMLCHTKAMNR